MVSIVSTTKLDAYREMVDVEISSLRVEGELTAREAFIRLLTKLGFVVEFSRTADEIAFAWMLPRGVSEKIFCEVVTEAAIDGAKFLAARTSIPSELLNGISLMRELYPASLCLTHPEIRRQATVVSGYSEMETLCACCCLALDRNCDLFREDCDCAPAASDAHLHDFAAVRYGYRFSALMLELTPIAIAYVGNYLAIANLWIKQISPSAVCPVPVPANLRSGITAFNTVFALLKRSLDEADPKWLNRVPDGDAQITKCRLHLNAASTLFENLKAFVSMN